jgi:predicted GNAT family N-acyltransferase
MPHFSIINHNSKEYDETVALRYEVLRRPLGLEFTSEQLAAESNDIHIVGYDMNDNLLCCLILTTIDTSIVQMRQVAVSFSEQGRGVGRQLVGYSENVAKQAGFKEMILHARESAVEFYLKLKYELYGEPYEEVGIPHRSMRKYLSESQ